MRARLLVLSTFFVVIVVAFTSISVWLPAERATAQDGDIPALQTQVADLERRVTALENASGTATGGKTSDASTPVAAGDEGIVIEGTTDGLTETFELDEGRYSTLFECGDSSGFAEFIGEDPDAYYPTIFSDRGTTVEEFEAGKYALQVYFCGSDWKLTLKPFSL